MKTKPTLLILAGVLGLSVFSTGCVIVRTREVPTETVVTQTTSKPGYVVTTLPAGTKTRVYKGTTYYYYDGVYYQPQGRRYIVVTEPR